MRRQVVFIAGMYHSGTTLLDLMLGKHPRFVGLGEIYFLLTRGAEPMCSCGQPTDACPYWSQVLKETRPGETLPDRLGHVLTVFERTFDDRVLVDSSKVVEALELLHARGDVDLKVIHLVRDVRSWSVSLGERDRRLRRHGTLGPIRAVTRKLTHGALPRFVQWYRGNLRIEAFLERTNVPHLRIGYEELVFYPRTIVPRLCEFLGVEEVESMYVAGESKSHVAYGNPIRSHSTKLKGMFYDNRWLQRTSWLLPSLLLHAPVMRYNASRVYGNVQYASSPRPLPAATPDRPEARPPR